MKQPILFALLVLLVGSCGEKDDVKPPVGSASGAPPAASTDKAAAPPAATPVAAAGADLLSSEHACTLLTQAQAATVLGMKVNAGKAGDVGCTWDAESGGLNVVILGLRNAAMWDQAKQITRDMAKQGEKIYEDIPGIGEGAFYSNIAGHQVVFKVGERYAELGLLGPKDDDSKKRLFALAKVLAGTL